MKRSVRLSVCPIDWQQQRWPAGLLLGALRPGNRSTAAGAAYQLQVCSSAGAAQHGAQQQMRAVSRLEPRNEAEHGSSACCAELDVCGRIT